MKKEKADTFYGSRQLVREIGELRFKCQKSQVPETLERKSLPAFRKEARELLKSSKKADAVFEFYRPRGKLKALLLIHSGSAYSFLKKVQGDPWQFKLLCDWEDPSAMDWARKKIAEHQKLLRTHEFTGFLEAGLWPLLPEFKKGGLSIDSIVALGRTDQALRSSFDPGIWPEELAIRRTLKKDIPQILNLIRREFKRNPQFGWIVTTPEFMKMTRKSYLKDCQRKHAREFVILKNNKVVGHFGMGVHAQSAFGLRVANLGVGLERGLQGKGLSRPIYAHFLKLFRRERIQFFSGTTAQPGVMKIAAELGREVMYFSLCSRKPHFPAEYFLKYPVWPKGIKNRPEF